MMFRQKGEACKASVVFIIKVLFLNLQNLFNISNGIDGYAIYFTINSTVLDSNVTCSSVTIVVSSCLHGVCVAALPVSCFFLNSSVVVSIFASNKLGDGPITSVIMGMLRTCKG